MEYTIDTTPILNSIQNGNLMPYFLLEDNELLFKENMMELYAQLEQESPDSLYYDNKLISESDWNSTKFVGSFFTSLFCNWVKIIKHTNLFFIEVNDDFPGELTLEMDEDSFVLFYRAEEGMISRRDECILDAHDTWINDFFDWLYNEITEVGSITNLANKYKAFTEIFTGMEIPEDDEPFEFPDEFYENLDNMKRSILAVLEEELEDMDKVEKEGIDSEKLLAAVKGDAPSSSAFKKKVFDPLTVKFNWNGSPMELSYPLDITMDMLTGNFNIAHLDNENGWLAQQPSDTQETVAAFWADYIYLMYLANAGEENKEILFDADWIGLGEHVRDWLRNDCSLDIKKIERKIRSTPDKLRSGGKITSYMSSDQPDKFLKSVLYIEKCSAISAKKHCLIDVENVPNQYFYALNNDNVLSHIWGAITQEKIQKSKTRKTFIEQFNQLKEKFPNFHDVIDYYSGAMYIFEQTRTPPAPVLLLGSPGLGKTHFANEIAKVVGSLMTVIPVSSLTAGWIISGSAAQWKDAQMGKIATALFNGSSMSPVIVLDEIDKKSEGNYDPLGALYPLLEYQTAKEFVDEYLEFPIDASNVIWVATANNLNTLPEPILDRFVVFDIAKLNHEDTIKVAKNIFNELTLGLNPQVLSDEILDILKDKTPRQIKQILKKALAYAAVQRTQDITLQKEHLDLKTKIKKIGF